ncbi:MAG: dynamin family protein, partial [Candidatus Thermoplasmatota archaeon]
MARGKSSNNRRTRATAPPRRSDGPIVPRTHLDEGESRRRLGDIFGSWLCTDWHQHDFGLDGMVEITQPLAGASDQRLNTGAKFSYQLKARSDDPATDGSFALPIDVVHLQYWLRATEFVMLVRYDIKSKRLHYRWVDDDLVGELTRKNAGWHGQSTVTIAFRASHELTQAALSTIADHASRRKRITRGHLAPGEFFRLKDALAEESKAMRAIALTLRSDSIAAGVEQVTAQLERSCYVVAVAGPSRVGKSTLLNMLVGRDVSPVDTLPTTAVPMIVVPAASEYIRVDYLDGRHEMLPFSVETVASFVAQDNNPDNGKGVKLLRLGLVNADLERGIAFLDVPGVDDLSPGIRALTIAVLSTAHAVVYVVDGSPMAEGGFALRRPDLDELTRLGGGADRLFFVVNKCDKLDQPQREKLAWYLKTQFTKYGVEKSLPTPALLLSVQESARARRGELGDDSVKQLEDAMWDFLVNSQTTGIDSLRASCGLLAGLAEDATTLLRARLITLDDVTKIKVQMVTARTGLGNLRPQMALEKQRVWTNCQRRMRESEHAILEHLRTQLEAISEEKPLPSDNDVKRFLEQRAMAAFTHEAEMLRVELQTSALLATRTLNDALGDLQEGIKRSQPVVQLPVPVITVEHLTAPASAAPLWGLGLGLIGFLAGPAEGAALALIGLFGGLFISAETLRRRKIQH